MTYEEYLAKIPAGRREHVRAVWDLVRANARGFDEEIGPKFLALKKESEWYVALANQKRYISLYLIPVYCFPELKKKLDAGGKKIRGGKSCISFTDAADLPLETIAEIVRAYDADTYLRKVREIRAGAKKARKKR